MTLNNPKFDLKKSLDTLRYLNEIFDFVPRYRIDTRNNLARMKHLFARLTWDMMG